jgi:hypothetical protein
MSQQTTSTDTSRPPAATAVGALAVLGVVGSVVMTLAHLGLGIPALDALGPGRLIVPAAASFAVGTVLYAIVAYGALRVAGWAWLAGLVVNTLAFVTSAFPYRGWVSGAAMAVSIAAIAVLLSPPGRSAFRG